MNRAVATILVSLALLGAKDAKDGDKPEPNSSDKIFLYWDINSSLGLPGGPTPSQVAAQKPPAYRSPEEFGYLDDAEIAACQRYSKVSALHRAAAIGGELEKFAAAGYSMSCAQARFAWARGKASEAVARLEQSVKFAELWADAAQAAYEAGKVAMSETVAASEAKTKAQIALVRVRDALEHLGYDLKDVKSQPQIDPKNARSDDRNK